MSTRPVEFFPLPSTPPRRQLLPACPPTSPIALHQLARPLALCSCQDGPPTSPWDPTLPATGLLQHLPLFCTWTLLHTWRLGGTWDPPTGQHTVLAKLTSGAGGEMVMEARGLVGPRCEGGSWAGRPWGVSARRLLAHLRGPASALRTGAAVRVFPARAVLCSRCQPAPGNAATGPQSPEQAPG